MGRKIAQVRHVREVFIADSSLGMAVYAGLLSNGIVYADIFEEKSGRKAVIILRPGEKPYVCGDLKLVNRLEEARYRFVG